MDKTKTYVFVQDYITMDGDTIEAGMTIDYQKLLAVDVAMWVVDGNEGLLMTNKAVKLFLENSIIEDYEEYMNTPNKHGFSRASLNKADREYDLHVN